MSVLTCAHDSESTHTSKCLRSDVRASTLLAIRKYRQDHPDGKCHETCGCMTYEELLAKHHA